jgi:hypothetical protein
MPKPSGGKRKKSSIKTKRTAKNSAAKKREAMATLNTPQTTNLESADTSSPIDSQAQNLPAREKISEEQREVSEASRDSYRRLVHPQNYHEYMKASKFRRER